jgi:hypothetical protein
VIKLLEKLKKLNNDECYKLCCSTEFNYSDQRKEVEISEKDYADGRDKKYERSGDTQTEGNSPMTDLDVDERSCPLLPVFMLITVERHLSGLNGKASHSYMQKIRIIGFLFENRLHWQFAVRLLLFTVCICV